MLIPEVRAYGNDRPRGLYCRQNMLNVSVLPPGAAAVMRYDEPFRSHIAFIAERFPPLRWQVTGPYR